MSSHRSLLLRSNRVLGASLVEHNLVNIEHLEAANERLFEILKSGVTPQASLLAILLGEMGSLHEADLIGFAIREYGLGLIDLNDHLLTDETREMIEPELTWATWVVPFDREDGFNFLATSYYLSAAARQYWEDRLEGQVIWYITSMNSIVQTVARVKEEAKHTR